MTPAQVGARLALANLSNLAAMAAAPRWALVSIGVDPEREIESLVELEEGIERTLGEHGAGVVGGNLSAIAGDMWIALTLLGEVEPGLAWTRNGARPGDSIAVTGFPGRAAMGLAMTGKGPDGGLLFAPRNMPGEMLDAWIRPTSRVAFARVLAKTGAVTAAIDISDGLAADLQHLCEASGVGASLQAWGPEDVLLERAANGFPVELRQFRAASDDYELLLTFDPGQRSVCEAVAREQGVPFTVIGECTDAPGILTVLEAGRVVPIETAGYDHFRG
jgi:thiamine-monophosphate kinase